MKHTKLNIRHVIHDPVPKLVPIYQHALRRRSKAAVLCTDYVIAPCRFNSECGGEAKLQRQWQSQQGGV
jgi:hypothetical protein